MSKIPTCSSSQDVRPSTTLYKRFHNFRNHPIEISRILFPYPLHDLVHSAAKLEIIHIVLSAVKPGAPAQPEILPFRLRQEVAEMRAFGYRRQLVGDQLPAIGLIAAVIELTARRSGKQLEAVLLRVMHRRGFDIAANRLLHTVHGFDPCLAGIGALHEQRVSRAFLGPIRIGISAGPDHEHHVVIVGMDEERIRIAQWKALIGPVLPGLRAIGRMVETDARGQEDLAGVILDITAKRQIEEQKEKLEDRLRQAYEAGATKAEITETLLITAFQSAEALVEVESDLYRKYLGGSNGHWS